MFQPSRPGLARKGAQDTRKRVRPGPYMFTTVPSRQPIPSVRNYGWMGDRRVRLTKRVDATTKEISPLFPLIDLLLSLFFFSFCFWPERLTKWKKKKKKRFRVLSRRRKIKRNWKRIQVVAQFIPPDRGGGDIINARRLENLIPRDHRESVIFTREISPNLDRYLARTGPLIRNVRSGYGNRVTPRKRTVNPKFRPPLPSSSIHGKRKKGEIISKRRG